MLSLFLMFCFRIRIPDFKERLMRHSEGRTLASNLIYTIWAVCGGFILHFLLCNYLTVLLKPSYEEPVDNTADLIKRDITPFYSPGGEIFKQMFAASTNPNFKEISRRLIITKDYDEYQDMVRQVTLTGMFADLGPYPYWFNSTEEFKFWYRSSETIPGDYPFMNHLTNKKWPLKKVVLNVGSIGSSPRYCIEVPSISTIEFYTLQKLVVGGFSREFGYYY